MQLEQLFEAERILHKNRRRRIWQRIVSAMACLVAFCTTYVLILPAITQENAVTCGLDEHTHSESCYMQITAESVVELTCSPESLGVHTHSEACLDADGNKVCGLVDYIVHTHDASCLDAAGNLICALPEHAQHVHADSCYESMEPEIHAHGDFCYTLERGELVCELPESDEHSHTDACYEQVRTAVCGMEEGTVIEAESILICTEPEAPVHVHLDACFTTIETEPTRELTCALEEHTHSLACYADLTADVETAEVWEVSFANAARSGVWTHDVLAIAETQLGYQESTRNYIVLEDGKTTKGYTRYGAWYGDPYGDWCAMFASFCLHYASVEEMPLDSNCPNWIAELTEAGLYQANGAYVPEAGNLIFFDWDGDNDADHVGFVSQLNSHEETGVLQISTIEGNSGNRVQSNTYAMDDVTILGYGTLPVQLTEEEQAQVDRVIAMIDAMSSGAEIDAKVEEFAAAGDEDGEIAWLEETYQQVAEAYYYYSLLTDAQKAKVTNADKLLELEYIWSVTTYNDEITSDAPTAITSANTRDFIELNLYDYNGNINTNYNNDKDWPGFQWNGGAYDNGSYSRRKIDYIDFGNSMITDRDYAGSGNGKATTAWNIGRQGGNINEIVQYPTGDWANKPVGMSTGTEVLGRTLTTAGYPWVTNAGSMVDYFSNSSFATKQNSQSIDGLFQINEDSGAYYYNSRWNHAQFDSRTDTFQLYEDIITPNFITYPFGNFLPFNDITNSSNATQVGAIGNGKMGDYVQEVINDLVAGTEDATEQQLIDMLEKYRSNLQSVSTTGGTAWTTWSAKDAIYDYIGNGPTDDTGPITDELLEKMYNIDWDVDTNFFFGMEMKMRFMQPKDGMTGKDKDGDGDSDFPMEFYFTGDDDVWIYIDGTLFLDLSGIHRHVGGEIDFVNGKVHYYALDTQTGDVAAIPYKTYTFAELLTAAGKSTDMLNSNGTFSDYSIHDFNFYYMERGSGSSVCRMNFNFPLLRKNTISVSKENVTLDGVAADEVVVGNPDYYFNLMSTTSGKLFVGPNSVTGVTQYKVEDSDGNFIKNADGTDKVFQTDQYGIFTLKAGQTAYFEGISENSGKYYVQELIRAEDNNQYPTVYVNEELSRYNALIDWSGRTYFSDDDSDNYTGPYGYKWYGRSGYDTDPSTNAAFHFEQQNRLDTAKLGKLQITKKVETYDPARAVTCYKMYVTLDGEPLAKGTVYDVGGSSRTVTETGYIEIADGETATISNIISGTQFHVTEDSASAKGYTVGYAAVNAENVETNANGISGTIHIGDSSTAPLVSVTVTNAERGAAVEIPVTKGFAKADGVPREFTFTLQQVTDATGTTPVAGGKELTAVIATPGETSASFGLTYFSKAFDVGEHKFYYKITENGPVTGTLENTQAFIAEITVTKQEGSEELTATTKIYPLGGSTAVDATAFVNTIVGDLKLEKIVDGSTEAQSSESFDFTIALSPGDSGIPLRDSYPVTLYQANGEIVQTAFSVTDGVIYVNKVYHGESIVIHDLPIGTTWSITETAYDGYVVKTAVTVGGNTTSGVGAVTGGSIVAGDTSVVYTNQQQYALPETGGAGTTLYTMAGLMLMLCSMAFLLYRFRKRGKEVQ